MRKNYTLILLLSYFTWNLTAQVDLPSVGNSYLNNTYYNITDGAMTSHAYTEWDIAFGVGSFDAGVFINESVGISFVEDLKPVELYLTNSTDFATTDSTGMTRIYNDEVSWSEGAFNLVGDENDPFDLGWGSYNNGVASGTRVFIVKLRSENYQKLIIDQLAGGVYSFRHANLDGSNEQSFTINKSDYAGKTLAYYSLENAEELNLEPENWDLLFTRYQTELPFQGGLVDYVVTGALNNNGVEVAQADDIDPNTVDHSDYEDNYTTQLDEIGSDWKDYQGSWLLELERVYFVKTTNQELWKLWFFDFEGSSTGVTSVQKTFISEITSVEDEFENLESFTVFPNPASDHINIAFEITTTERTGNLKLINQLGQTVLEKVASIENGLNIKKIPLNLPTGMYHLALQVQDEVITRPIIIK